MWEGRPPSTLHGTEPSLLKLSGLVPHLSFTILFDTAYSLDLLGFPPTLPCCITLTSSAIRRSTCPSVSCSSPCGLKLSQAISNSPVRPGTGAGEYSIEPFIIGRCHPPTAGVSL